MRVFYAFSVLTLAGMVLLAAGCLPSRPHPLEDKSAPMFVSVTTDGNEVALADHLGQDIVVLDFWASWCPPCREGLPALEELAEAYQGQPVAVYAVNQGEDFDTAGGYIRAEGLNLTVLMDEETKIGALYGVRGIPQIVIIDKGGKVAEVHRGYRSGDERHWMKTIDGLLSK